MALTVASVVVWAVGLEPLAVMGLLVKGAWGSPSGISYTLYYSTTFVFTGLAVAVAFHAGLFNIGGEGQAAMGGLGTGLVALAALQWVPGLPAAVLVPGMVLGAMLFGAAWAAVPAALQAWRGSHVVITTIMFNFLAAALMGYLLVEVLKEPGTMDLQSRAFEPAARMPGVHELLQAIGVDWPATPLNLTAVLAVGALGVSWWLLWKSRSGFELRASGHAPAAALYAGVDPRRQVMLAMVVSGALAGLVGVNEIAGVHQRLLPDFVAGAGFAGIAVSLIGRNHPVGIAMAALLFGTLYQGGAELTFEVPGFSRDMVFTLQGLIVLFAGALSTVMVGPLLRVHRRLARRADPVAQGRV
ncbi:MAG: ABC transporter permease [Betaproteobacteria bacterium]|nr:ABC transporter permease [Betaproteobacteria bacterium]